MFVNNFILLTFIFLFTVHCDKSTGILSEDFTKIKLDEKCIKDYSSCKQEVVKSLPEDAKALAKAFYDEKKTLYENKIKFELIYSNVVNDVFVDLIIKNESLTNETNITETIYNSSKFQDKIDEIKDTYKNDIDNLINEGLQLAKENIYYDDKTFDDFYSKNLSSIVNQFKEQFYNEQIGKMINVSFNAAYNTNKLKELLEKAINEVSEKENNETTINATLFKKHLFPWAPFIYIKFDSIQTQDNDTNNYSFLNNLENVELQLLSESDNQLLCSVPMKQKMYDEENQTLSFNFDVNCLQKIDDNTNVTLEVLEKNKGFTKYNFKYKFTDLTLIVLKQTEINLNKFDLDSNNKYIIPKEINGSFIEYSFDQNDFEYIDNTNNENEEQNISLREYGSTDLKLIIYDDNETLSFASDNCVYGNYNQTLKDDWENNLSKLLSLNVTPIDKYLSTINSKLPDHLKSIARNFYRTKKAYFKKQIENSIKVDFRNKIETQINKHIERKLRAHTFTDNVTCENEIKNKHNEILAEIYEEINVLYQKEFNNLIEEGKREVKTKVYFNDPNFDEFYNKEISQMVDTFGKKFMIYQLNLLIETAGNNNFGDENDYNDFITNQCNHAANISEAIKNQNQFNNITNTESCFSFIKTEITDWALTLALKIKDDAKNEEHCTLSKDTTFFLTTSVKDSNLNSVQCELQFKPNMLNDNILYLNFKNGNCNYFPSLLGDNTYYLGTKVKLTNIVTYQKQFVFPDNKLTYYKTSFPNIDTTVIKNYNETVNKCYLPKQIEFTDSFVQDLNLSNIYIEYSTDGKQFTFEQKDLIHKLPSQNSNAVSVIIHNGSDVTKVLFAAHNCEYVGELTCNECRNHKECQIHNQKVICICNDGFYGDTCEEKTSNETMVTEINDKLYDILKDDNFIVDIDNNVATINSNKVKAMTNLAHLMRQSIKNRDHTQGIANITQINTLNSITENYLTNAKHDKNSIYLLALAINGNIMKLHHKRRPHGIRKLQEITESEEMIKQKIAQLLHMGTVHASTKDLSDSSESDLELLEDNIYTHQWTAKSLQSAFDKINKYNLSSLDPMTIKCGNPNGNYQYTLTEVPAELAREIYEDDKNETSKIISFNIKDIDNPESTLNCPSIKFQIPATGMNLASNYKIDGKHTLNLYEVNSGSFMDKCYRGDFDFDLTEKIKKDIVDNHAIKTISPLSKNCYSSNYDENNEKVILQCSSENTDLMIAFKVENFSNKIESGSLFECSTDIEHIEKNIAFWIYLVVTLLTIIGIIFYVSVKYSEKQNSLMRINRAIDYDGLNKVDSNSQLQQGQDTERAGALHSEVNGLKVDVVKLEERKLEPQSTDTFGTIFVKNFIELHPLINPFIPSLITPLSIRLAFFSFNFLNIFGFNAVFSTNDYLFDRYKTEDRDKFIFPIRDHFDKMISAIVCTMGVAALMRAIILVTYNKKKELSEDIKESKDRNEVIKEFRKEMIVSRCICVFIMMIITAWFFYFTIAWCNRYPKAQHSWGDACAWCLMFNYILFSTVYIVIISAVQCNSSCKECAYYMKRTFMF